MAARSHYQLMTCWWRVLLCSGAEGCTDRASHGNPGHTRTHCVAHKAKGMVTHPKEMGGNAVPDSDPLWLSSFSSLFLGITTNHVARRVPLGVSNPALPCSLRWEAERPPMRLWHRCPSAEPTSEDHPLPSGDEGATRRSAPLSHNTACSHAYPISSKLSQECNRCEDQTRGWNFPCCLGISPLNSINL